MLIDKTAISRAVEVLKSEDFYRDSHKVIFNAILELYQKDTPIDIITLIGAFKILQKS